IRDRNVTGVQTCALPILAPNLKAGGEILFNGSNLLEMSSKKLNAIRGKQIAYIFQDYQNSFTPFMTIGKHFDEYQRNHLQLSKRSEERRVGKECRHRWAR